MAIETFIDPRHLSANCDEVEEREYLHEISPEEYTSLHGSIVEQITRLGNEEDEEKERRKEATKYIKDLKSQLKVDVQAAKFGKVDKHGKLYKFLYREERMVAFYDKNGSLVESRPMRASEAQISIMEVLKEGTND